MALFSLGYRSLRKQKANNCFLLFSQLQFACVRNYILLEFHYGKQNSSFTNYYDLDILESVAQPAIGSRSTNLLPIPCSRYHRCSIPGPVQLRESRSAPHTAWGRHRLHRYYHRILCERRSAPSRQAVGGSWFGRFLFPQRLLLRCGEDLSQLETWQILWDQIKTDPKLKELEHCLITNPVMKDQKVIIFTESIQVPACAEGGVWLR